MEFKVVNLQQQRLAVAMFNSINVSTPGLNGLTVYPYVIYREDVRSLGGNLKPKTDNVVTFDEFLLWFNKKFCIADTVRISSEYTATNFNNIGFKVGSTEVEWKVLDQLIEMSNKYRKL